LQRQEGQQDALVKNSRRLQKLALMQVIASTVAVNLHTITTQCSDRLLQKSMAGNLHQWLVEQNEAFLSDYDEFSSHMSLLGRQRGGSTLRGGSFQNSFESLLSSKTVHHQRHPTELRGLATKPGELPSMGAGKGHSGVHSTRHRASKSVFHEDASFKKSQ